MTQPRASSAARKEGNVSEPLGVHVRRVLAERDLTIRELCELVAVEIGERELSVPGIIKWLDQPERLLPYRVFALERVLDLPPGLLSRPLGYLPVEVAAVSDTRTAIENDERLTESNQRALLAAYREMVRERPKRRQHRTNGP